MKFYVYGLVDPRNEKTRYVGCTDNPHRRFRQHLRDFKSNKYKAIWVLSLLRSGLEPKISILSKHRTEINAIKKEKFFIKKLHKQLTNLHSKTDSVYVSFRIPPSLLRRIHRKVKIVGNGATLSSVVRDIFQKYA
jgi:predicted GIY-YIG superfamily endonuclease